MLDRIEIIKDLIPYTFEISLADELFNMCTTSGTLGNVNAQEINIIKNIFADITEVQGISIIKSGTDIESDYALRKRFNEAKEGLGACNENALRTALLRIETVTSVSVIVNEKDTEDSSGRPPHSFECYVAGGENHHYEIAQAIYEKKPLSIKTCGNENYSIIDNGGFTQLIKFSHCSYINIDVSMRIKINENFNETAGIKEIKNNISDYINNVGVGKNVVLSSLYGRIHAVSGVTEVLELSMAKDGSGSGGNIEIGGWEIAKNCLNWSG